MWLRPAGVLCVQVEIVMSEIDIFVSSMSIITLDHMKKLKNNTFVGNTGHFDNEIWPEGLNIKPQRIVSSFPLFTGHHASRFADEAIKGFFLALFPDFKKVRSPGASAEMTRQVEISTLSANKWLLPESSRTPAHGRRRPMSLEESSPPSRVLSSLDSARERTS